MADQISVEAGILIKLVRDLQKQVKLNDSNKINPDTLEDAIKICNRLEPLIKEHVEPMPRLSE